MRNKYLSQKNILSSNSIKSNKQTKDSYRHASQYQVIEVPYTFQQYVYFHSDQPQIKSANSLQPQLYNYPSNPSYHSPYQYPTSPRCSIDRKLSKRSIQKQQIEQCYLTKTISKQQPKKQSSIHQILQINRSKTQTYLSNKIKTEQQLGFIPSKYLQSSNVKSSKFKQTKHSLAKQSIKYHHGSSQIDNEIISKRHNNEIKDIQQQMISLLSSLSKTKNKICSQVQDISDEVLASKKSNQQSPWNINYRL